MPFVNQRWLGGTLTNYRTIKKRIERLRWLENFLENPVEGRYSKKELLQLEKERVKLAKVLSGIKTLDRLPDALFVIDPKKEHIAVQEARKLDVPVVAVVDTNCDPEDIDYPIPGNDDAIRAIKLFASRVADAILDGVGDSGREQLDGADRVVVARYRVVDVFRIAIGIHHGDDRHIELARLLHRDVLLLWIDHEESVGQTIERLDARENLRQ